MNMFNVILNDPNYLVIAIAVVGLMGGGFFSWLFTFFYFKKGQSRKLLCYTTRDTDYLGYRRADFHNLSVHYGDRRLANPVRYTLYVWNCGNVTINNSDISTVDPLGFGRSDIEILETAPIWSTRDSINPKLLIDVSKTKIFLEFDFLDPDDGFAVQFLADRPTQDRRWLSNLQVYGTIKGLHRAPFHVTAGFEGTVWWQTYIAVAAIAFFAFSTGAIAYDAWLSGMVVTSLIKVLAAIIFGLLTIAIIAMSFENFWGQLFVIPALLRKLNDNSEHDSIPPEVFARLQHSLPDSSEPEQSKAG